MWMSSGITSLNFIEVTLYSALAFILFGQVLTGHHKVFIRIVGIYHLDSVRTAVRTQEICQDASQESRQENMLVIHCRSHVLSNLEGLQCGRWKHSFIRHECTAGPVPLRSTHQTEEDVHCDQIGQNYITRYGKSDREERYDT